MKNSYSMKPYSNIQNNKVTIRLKNILTDSHTDI